MSEVVVSLGRPPGMRRYAQRHTRRSVRGQARERMVPGPVHG